MEGATGSTVWQFVCFFGSRVYIIIVIIILFIFINIIIISNIIFIYMCVCFFWGRGGVGRFMFFCW